MAKRLLLVEDDRVERSLICQAINDIPDFDVDSENDRVNWGNASLAAVYLKHFDRNYRQARPYIPGH